MSTSRLRSAAVMTVCTVLVFGMHSWASLRSCPCAQPAAARGCTDGGRTSTMGHVTAPLAELTTQAQTLTSAGDLVGARAVLVDALDPVDADPQRASPDLATAAALLARVLIALGDPHEARLWAGFAHAAEDRLHGPDDERTLAAAALHAAVLHRVGNHGRAVQLCHDLAGQLAD